jgi:hypothetical protein
MGLGPWAQGDLIRDIQRTERNRFKRAVKREFDFLHSKLHPGPVCSRDIIEACERLEAAARPKVAPQDKRPSRAR